VGKLQRRGFLIAASALVAAPRASIAQQPARKTWRIGALHAGSAPDLNFEAFRRQLREFGIVEGQNLVVEDRWAEGKPDRLPDLAVDLVQQKVDLLLAGGTEPLRALKKATATIPIVMAASGDPVGTGLVAGLARPGANVTGLSTLAPELTGKRLELIKAIVPALSEVAILSNQANPHRLLEFAWAGNSAQVLGLRLILYTVLDAKEVPSTLLTMTRAHAQAVVLLGDPLLFAHRTEVAEIAVKSAIPLLSDQAAYVEAGALFSYSANFADLYRQAARYADQILKGAKPADLPVQQATRFELVINLKTAKALGITIPQSILLRADRVI